MTVAQLERLQNRIGYTFSDQSLLSQSLVHHSFGMHNNERMEFLGDSILNFIVAEALYTKFPAANEGELSRLRARLVRQETLAQIARDFQLGEFLTMGPGELKSGGFKRDSILSDALEAVVGAMLLDSNVEVVITRVNNWFTHRLAKLSTNDLQKDAKSTLQEYLQGEGESVPEYVLIKVLGKSPNQEFEMECRCAMLKTPAISTGTSTKRAEQNAAAMALQLLGVK